MHVWVGQCVVGDVDDTDGADAVDGDAVVVVGVVVVAGKAIRVRPTTILLRVHPLPRVPAFVLAVDDW